MSRRWDESEHPRWPAGSPGDVDGQFRPKAGGKRDLATLSRSTLLKYARERGLVLPRGTDDDTIRQMIRRFDSGAEPEWVQRAGDKLAKKAPAKKAAPQKFDVAEVAGRVSNAKTERAVIELLASDPSLTAARLRKVAEYLGFEVPGDVRAKTSLQMLIAEREAEERKLPGGYEKVARRAPAKKAAARDSATQKVAAAAARVPKLEAKVENLRSRLELARDRRRAKKGEAGRFRGPAETKLGLQLMDAKNELARAREAAIPPFVEPERPDSSSDPQVLYQQAIDYADEMNAMMFGDRPRFMERPPLDALQGLQRGVDPKEVVAQLYREAAINPEEWGGSREYLNRLAGFLSLQSTTLPKAEAEKQRAARARWEGVLKEAGGDRYWSVSTRDAAGSITQALHRLTRGDDPAEVASDVEGDARSIRGRANAERIQDYDLTSTLAYDPASRREMGNIDARRLERLAAAIRAAGSDAIQEAGRRR